MQKDLIMGRTAPKTFGLIQMLSAVGVEAAVQYMQFSSSYKAGEGKRGGCLCCGKLCREHQSCCKTTYKGRRLRLKNNKRRVQNGTEFLL